MRALIENPGRGGSPADGRASRMMCPLDKGEVHIFWLPVLVDAALLSAYDAILSEDERARARRFRSRDDADRFVASHGGLRSLLSAYTGRRPGDLEFAAGGGKPSLGDAETAEGIRFNMSHSGDLVVVAVARGREIGVDVERIRPDLDLQAVARRCFSPAEQRRLCSTRGAAYEEMFYTFWTRKEAFVKALGEGIVLELAAIDVSGAPSVLESRWQVSDIAAPAGHRAALAVEGPGALVNCFDETGALRRTGTC